jgi:predicted nucleic acid-binding protein
MKPIVIDLNILLDYLEKREGYTEALRIMNLCYTKTVDVYICAHEITTLSYFLSKNGKDRSIICSIISRLLSVLKLLDTNNQVLTGALVSNVEDYEDAVIEVSALEHEIPYIVTRNIEDFIQSRVQAILPETYMKSLIK